MNILNYNSNIQCSFRPIVTIGAFDGVHIGHQAILQTLKKEGKEDAMVITFENHPRLVLDANCKDFSMLSTQKEKLALIAKQGIKNLLLLNFDKELASLSAADFVREILIKQLHTKGLILGYDNHFGNKHKGHFDEIFALAEQHKIFVKRAEAFIYEKITVSSTQIRHALCNGNISLGNGMLGYSYSLEAKVIEGEKIGRTLGFPTANLAPLEKLKLIPAQGVYAVHVKWEDQLFKGMMSIGKRLTFGLEGISLEVHIFDFSASIYDEILEIKFVEKFRDIVKFSSKEELIRQLEHDQIIAQRLLQN